MVLKHGGLLIETTISLRKDRLSYDIPWKYHILKKNNEFEANKSEKHGKHRRKFIMDDWWLENKQLFILRIFSANTVSYIARKNLI